MNLYLLAGGFLRVDPKWRSSGLRHFRHSRFDDLIQDGVSFYIAMEVIYRRYLSSKILHAVSLSLFSAFQK